MGTALTGELSMSGPIAFSAAVAVPSCDSGAPLMSALTTEATRESRVVAGQRSGGTGECRGDGLRGEARGVRLRATRHRHPQ